MDRETHLGGSGLAPFEIFGCTVTFGSSFCIDDLAGATSVSIGSVTSAGEATVTSTVTPSTAGKIFVRIEAIVTP